MDLNSIELTLKTPNQRVDDIQLKCNEDWTVKMLKEHLQDVYPSKPKSSSQRLIYLGKLLQDHVLLKEVFGVSITWGAKTLHIVCADTVNATPILPTTSNSTPVSASSSTSNLSDSTDGVRYRGPTAQTTNSVNPNQIPSSPQSPFASPPFSTTGSPNSPQQIYQQMYQQQYQMQMQQYYMQMHQWQQGMAAGQLPYQQMNINGSGQATPHTPPSTPATPSTPAPPAQNEEQQQQQPVQQPINDLQNRNNAPMNAGPGGAIMQADNQNGENAGNRDWLDVLYMSMRALMLLSIVYFYSSTSRFLLVTLLGFIVYLYQGGWFTPRRVQPPPQPQAPPVENRDEVDSNSTNENSDNSLDNTEEGENTSQQRQQTIIEPPRPSAIKIFCTFIVSFVTSLIPTAPPPLQQN